MLNRPMLILTMLAIFGFSLPASADNPPKLPSLPQQQPSVFETKDQSTGIPYAQPDPYYSRHVEYAKVLYKDKWAEHMGEITKKFSEYMKYNDPEDLNTTAGFNNFFFFASSVDFGLRLHYAALTGQLGQFEANYAGMKKAAQENDKDAFRDFADVKNIALLEAMSEVLEEAQARLLVAAKIYGVPLRTISDGNQKFGKLYRPFESSFIEAYQELAKGPVFHFSVINDEDMRSLLLNPLYDLLKNASFSYEKANGETGFVSFVTFGDFAFHKWGKYGGDGAIETAAFRIMNWDF